MSGRAGIIFIALMSMSVVALGETFYIAPTGIDTNPGTKNAPFASLERARDAVRLVMQKKGASASVVIRSGTYYLKKPFVLGPEDSGTKEHPITYSAQSGEKPVFRGGRVIKGWKHSRGNLWTTEIPDVKEGKWYFRQLFLNGERRQRPYLPVEGQYTIKAPGETPAKSFVFNPGEIDPNWHNLNDVEVVVLQHWTEARLRIATINQTTNTVTFTGDAWRPLDWSKGWYAENVWEGFVKPGQWYLDRPTGTLTYRPLPNENMETVEVVAPVTRHWIRFEGDVLGGKFVQYVQFKGLAFHFSDWSLDNTLGYSYPQAEIEQKSEPTLAKNDPAEGPFVPQTEIEVPAGIYARGAHNVEFENCEFAHTGAWVMDWAIGCQDNRIVCNHMFDLGAGGIRVGSPHAWSNDADESCRNTITDCHIHDGANVYLGAPAIWIGQSSGNLVANNDIHGAFQWAVSTGWNWSYMPPNRARDNRIEYNHVHDLGAGPLGTHGALYSLGVQPGTAVRYNHVHHIGGGGSGIVLDNASVGVTVEYNVVHNCEYASLLCNHNDLGNIVQNNVFALAGTSQFHRIGDIPADKSMMHQTGVFYRNIFYWSTGRLFERDDWIDYSIIMDYNLYFDVSGNPIKFCSFTFDDWNKKGLDTHSLIADPLFVDPQKGDFSLKPESPMFQLGWRPIDLSQVGPRKKSQRDAGDLRSK